MFSFKNKSINIFKSSMKCGKSDNQDNKILHILKFYLIFLAERKLYDNRMNISRLSAEMY